MEKPLLLWSAAHLLLWFHVLDIPLPFPADIQRTFDLQALTTILYPWFFALGIPLLIFLTRPIRLGQFDAILAWAAGAIFIEIWRYCRVFAFWGKEGGGDKRMCANSATAEGVFVGLTLVMIWRRMW
jgi:hypothetical protein